MTGHGPAPDRRRLIVTADDFGRTPWVNRAVEKAHRDGILRFASLMVQGGAAREAVRIARAHPTLGVGVHLDLCRESPAREMLIMPDSGLLTRNMA